MEQCKGCEQINRKHWHRKQLPGVQASQSANFLALASEVLSFIGQLFLFDLLMAPVLVPYFPLSGVLFAVCPTFSPEDGYSTMMIPVYHTLDYHYLLVHEPQLSIFSESHK